ncbi:MAG: fumarylacetoacetate hydrolase family protein [Terriglobales bacterium]
MKFCRFQFREGARYGLVEPVDDEEAITALVAHPAAGQRGLSAEGGLRIAERLAPPLPLSKAKLVAPVEPSKIVCVGRNYREHARELGNVVPSELMYFLKPPSSLVGPGEAIRLPRASQRVDHEGELGVIMAQRCKRLGDEEDVRPYILGYTCINDVTARDLQPTSGPWTRAKGFDTFCPVGPAVSDSPRSLGRRRR